MFYILTTSCKRPLCCAPRVVTYERVDCMQKIFSNQQGHLEQHVSRMSSPPIFCTGKHLDALTGQRKKDSPGDAFFYRPHSRNSDDKEEMMMIAGLKPKKTTHQMRFLTLHHQLLRTRLLFCHQTVKQMELLRKYTNEMCLMMPLIAPQNYQLSLICLTHNFKLLAADWQPCPVKV